MVFHIVNFYKFVAIDDLESLSTAHGNFAHDHDLKGTLLLAPEGVNVGLAGDLAALKAYERFVKEDPRFADVEFKYSEGKIQPYKGLLVKIKPWIIRFAENEQLTPDEINSGARLTPQEWHELINSGRDDVVVVDTRNWYETDYGKFESAVTLPVKKFTQFPDVFEQLYGDQRDKTFLFYCTGGVRCEKVVPWANKHGFKNAYQLDGGILNYFKEVGADGYEGNCFVFDHRWIVDATLKETDDSEGQNLRIQPKPLRGDGAPRASGVS